MMLKAKPLLKGDTIGVISPSWGGAGLFPHRVDQAKAFLEQAGYQVKFADHAFNHISHVSDNAENRANDLNQMFLDPDVKLVLATIGGDHSCQMLPHLDFDLIRSHPKLFMGYSDVTVLNLAIYQQTGLVTFNGPALMPDFGEFPAMQPYSFEQWLAVVTQSEPVGNIPAAPEWTQETLRWENRQDQIRPRTMHPSPGWLGLKPGKARGKLLGGCIESLQHLRGTHYWPDWHKAIFFWETSEDKPSPETIDGILMDYENMGVFEQIHGMMVGRAMDYSDEEKAHLRQIILERTKTYDFPILCEMDFGHTAPQMTLPIGCLAEMDADRITFSIGEAAVSD